MDSISGFINGFHKTFGLNLATLSGAIDIIAVQHPDGKIYSTPFHVKFGKLQLLYSKQKKVTIAVNGVEQDFIMNLGDAGEAYFLVDEDEVTETGSPEGLRKVDGEKIRKKFKEAKKELGALKPDYTTVEVESDGELENRGEEHLASSRKFKKVKTPSSTTINEIASSKPRESASEESSPSTPKKERSSSPKKAASGKQVQHNQSGTSKALSIPKSRGKESSDEESPSLPPKGASEGPKLMASSLPHDSPLPLAFNLRKSFLGVQSHSPSDYNLHWGWGRLPALSAKKEGGRDSTFATSDESDFEKTSEASPSLPSLHPTSSAVFSEEETPELRESKESSKQGKKDGLAGLPTASAEKKSKRKKRRKKKAAGKAAGEVEAADASKKGDADYPLLAEEEEEEEEGEEEEEEEGEEGQLKNKKNKKGSYFSKVGSFFRIFRFGRSDSKDGSETTLTASAEAAGTMAKSEKSASATTSGSGLKKSGSSESGKKKAAFLETGDGSFLGGNISENLSEDELPPEEPKETDVSQLSAANKSALAKQRLLLERKSEELPTRKAGFAESDSETSSSAKKKQQEEEELARRQQEELEPLTDLASSSFQLSLAGKQLNDASSSSLSSKELQKLFDSKLITFEQFKENPTLLSDKSLVVRLGSRYVSWEEAAPLIMSLLVYKKPLPLKSIKQLTKQDTPTSSWRWAFWRSSKPSGSGGSKSDSQAKPVLAPKGQSKTLRPTSDQLKSMNLKEGANIITFTVSSRLQGTQTVAAKIFLWHHEASLVISDVDGTITKSDVLGQILPVLGRDWSHSGVTKLFSKIQSNGYHFVYLTARAIGQAPSTKGFLNGLVQGLGKTMTKLPEGPLFMSPDGLIRSFTREVIQRKPHEFKIACLEDIKRIFPKGHNPFVAGFGNRESDVISYKAIGIKQARTFIINPKGELRIPSQTYRKTYDDLDELVHNMFPTKKEHHVDENYNDFSFWKLPLDGV